MFSVLFEVHPKGDEWDTYLGLAKMLKPELERIDGFVDNIRYRSLTREGWILSLSSWRDEKSVVRWRTQATHHNVQEKGRHEVFLDYRLRVGEITHDDQLPENCELKEQRFDETEVAGGTTVTLISTSNASNQLKESSVEDFVASLGFNKSAPGIESWDVYDAVLTPGDAILMISWKTEEDANTFRKGLQQNERFRHRQVRVVRHYSMMDRREAPQFYEAVTPN